VTGNVLSSGSAYRRTGWPTSTRGTGRPKYRPIDDHQMIRGDLVTTSLRFMTWGCVTILAVLSLLPAQHTVRTSLPGQLEHFIAHAGPAAIAMVGYGLSRGGMRIIGGFWVDAGVLEYLHHFSPGRRPSLEDLAASALGALRGGLAASLLWRSLALRRPLGR
jgi:VanZ family protein